MSTRIPDFLLSEQWLGVIKVWLLASGKPLWPWGRLGADPCTRKKVAETVLAVGARNACQVAVVCDFKHWDASQYVMRNQGSSFERHGHLGEQRMEPSQLP